MDGSQKFEIPSWNHIYELLIELAGKLKERGFKPDVIVGISRGGWVPARILSDLLENPNIANIKVEFYLDIYKTAEKPTVTQPVSISIEKKKVLVVDDVSDTGKTLRLVCEEMKKEAVEVKVVTLYCKPWSEYKPDFCIKTTNAWIIFPWERCEMIKALERKMAIEGKTKKDVEEALRQMGLKSSIVKLFVKDIFGKRKYDEDKRIQ